MTVLLPHIGVTYCDRAISLLNHCKENVVGSFWLMCGYGFSTENIPSWWGDIVLEENQAQAIIDSFDKGYIIAEHEDPLYLGFCIIIVAAEKSNPATLSYVIQHLRMLKGEGVELLKIMAKYNIPTHTEVTYPKEFLKERYPEESKIYQHLQSSIRHWTVQVWEDYCSFLMAEHGQKMLADYWKKLNTR